MEDILAEVGVLDPVAIFKGSFGGERIWSNPYYINPNDARRIKKRMHQNKYEDRKDAQEMHRDRMQRPDYQTKLDPIEAMYKPPQHMKKEKYNKFKNAPRVDLNSVVRERKRQARDAERLVNKRQKRVDKDTMAFLNGGK
eukprot:CAMPEP_0168533964 /NCGR_PEP_ID=MMETSP0405-20121227/17509_1 /TAXON_ID=498012 /ORGANISM="Trichosphaerium sp, Strain Am-I-7 wt" /LENGTH=139 /DNA_ID=CAMNT_0008560363 /DNA_START=609 /DNA_END=1028 /DNA_ORIENTATION=-